MIRTLPARSLALHAAAATAAMALVLSGCGSDDSTDSAVAAATDQSAAQPDTQADPDSDAAGGGAAPSPRMPDGGGFPGAFGEVSAVDGGVAQVRNQQTGQVAVTWTDATRFTTTVTATMTDIRVGDCVVVSGSQETPDVAATVQVSQPVDGECTGTGLGGSGLAGPGFPGPGGGQGRPIDLPTDLPTEFPTDMPSGMPTDLPQFGGQGPGQGSVVIGEVTAIDGESMTLNALTFGAPARGEATGSPTTEARTITIGADAVVSTDVDTSADAIVVGKCLTAAGQSDDVGAVTADTIAISDPVDGQCGVGGVGAGMRPGGGSGS